MQDPISSHSKALLGIVALVLVSGSPSLGAASTDKAVKPVAASSSACAGAKCAHRPKHAHARQVQAIKVKLDPPVPDEKTINPVHSTGGPATNPGH